MTSVYCGEAQEEAGPAAGGGGGGASAGLEPAPSFSAPLLLTSPIHPASTSAAQARAPTCACSGRSCLGLSPRYTASAATMVGGWRGWGHRGMWAAVMAAYGGRPAPVGAAQHLPACCCPPPCTSILRPRATEAVQLANDTQYGLACYFYTKARHGRWLAGKAPWGAGQARPAAAQR